MTRAETAIIVVTDLVGSTAIRSEIGEDAAEELRRRHDAVLAEAVASFGGVVVKGLGDGVLARFTGAASAVAASCTMQRHVDGRFDIRIGVSAGDVTLENDDCFGTPVIEASRLCDRAEGGQILVADLVRLLARGRGGHVYEPVGDLELKGVTEPVAASRVVWDGSRYDGVRFPAAMRIDDAPIVGRDRELETIMRRWRDVTAGTAKVIFVSGEPGIGKTRFIVEATRTIHRRGGIVLYGRCREEAAASHDPFREALTPLVTDLPDHVIGAHVREHGGALVGLVPIMASRVPRLETSSLDDSDRLADEALVDLLRRASGVAPVTLVLDDLHRAGQTTAETFSRLAQHADLGSTLIIGSYSHTEIRQQDPIRTVLLGLRRADGIERIRLRGLEVGAVAALLVNSNIGRTTHERTALAAEIHRQTGGSPYFIEETLRLRASKGAAYRLERSTRATLGIVGAAGLLAAVAILASSFVMGHGLSALEWLAIAGAVAFFGGAGAWLLAQMASQVVLSDEGLVVTSTGRLTTTTIRWDEIDAIRWRPPMKWTGDREGGFFIETVDGKRVSNPLIDHPTPEFADAMYGACRLHGVNDMAIRAKWPKLRSGTTTTADPKPLRQVDEHPRAGSISAGYDQTAARFARGHLDSEGEVSW